MNVTYEKKDAMTFIGYHTEIRPEDGYQKCPEFWDKEYASKYARLWQTMRPETAVEKAILENGIGMFAICAESPNGFAYWIAGLYRGGEVPEGLELYSFPGEQMGGVHDQRANTGVSADAEHGGLAGMVPG